MLPLYQTLFTRVIQQSKINKAVLAAVQLNQNVLKKSFLLLQIDWRSPSELIETVIYMRDTQLILMKTALVIVDLQNDFISGSLAVPGAEALLPPLLDFIAKHTFDTVVLTKDSHPADHMSFASAHSMTPFQTITYQGAEVELWPDHCVQGTWGAEITNRLCVLEKYFVVQKGQNKNFECYSGFGHDNQNTGLEQHLLERGIERVVVAGLAFDFCVGSTALDAARLGFRTEVLGECTRAVAEQSRRTMQQRLGRAGVRVLKHNSEFKHY